MPIESIRRPSVLRLRTMLLHDARAFAQCGRAIEDLRRDLGAEDDLTLSPQFFLAATDDESRSCAVACWDGERLVGVLYATERYVRGFRSGYCLGGDYSGRGMLLCSAEYEALVVEASVQRLIREGAHSVHLRFLPRFAAKPEFAGLKTMCLDGTVLGDRLQLPSNFEDFLQILGKHTRRNVRSYTRKASIAGIEFVPGLTEDEYEAAVVQLNARTDFPANARRLARDRRHISLCGGGQRFGLRGLDGALVAVLSGFTRGTRFHLLTQLNDAHRKQSSLSLVLRGYMVKHLIEGGHTEVQFMGGSSLALGQFCTPQKYRSLIVDKATGAAALFKFATRQLVTLSTRCGRPLPLEVETLCRGFLDPAKLRRTTALGPSATAGAPDVRNELRYGDLTT